MATILKEANFNGKAGSHFKIRLSYDLSQSQANNTSTIKYYLYMISMDGYSGSGTTSKGYINGSQVGTFTSIGVNTTKEIGTKTVTITHNSDGTKSVSYSASVDTPWTLGDASLSGTLTLPTIKRLATISTAVDFNDEDNPTITFDNPAGFTVKPYINFYDNNNNRVYQLYRDISATSPYNWAITSAERTAMRNTMTSQPTYRAQMGVDTYNGSTNLGYNSVARTFSFVNANPTQTITTTETNQKIVTLLGTNTANTIVQNASNLTFSVTPTALKSATISKVELNGVPDTTSPYEFTNIVPTTNNFVVKTTDSRTLSVENTITKTMINYEPIDVLSVSFKRYASTSSDVILNAEIKYKQATFGSTANIPTIKWKIGEDGQENTLSSSDYTIDTQNNRITISNLTLTDAIPYNNAATFYLLVQDLLTSDSDADDVGRGIPTFEAGEDDFQVNGDLYIADTDRQNPINVGETLGWLKTQNILWSGAMYMNENQTAYLSENISDQPHGIVLVWSAYSNGQGANWDWKFTHIPKKWLEINGDGAGVCETMSNNSFTAVGAKYVYISDDHIGGNANNTSNGTNSGITYTNTHWVLRYVIGV